MRDIRFHEDRSIGGVAHLLVERHRMCLCMQQNRLGALRRSVFFCLCHNSPAKSLSAFDSQHTTEVPFFRTVALEKTRISDDLPLAEKGTVAVAASR